MANLFSVPVTTCDNGLWLLPIQRLPLNHPDTFCTIRGCMWQIAAWQWIAVDRKLLEGHRIAVESRLVGFRLLKKTAGGPIDQVSPA